MFELNGDGFENNLIFFDQAREAEIKIGTKWKTDYQPEDCLLTIQFNEE